MRQQKLLLAELRRNLEVGGRPRLPAGCDLYWLWFCDLSSTRTMHAAGYNPLSYAEIEAYFRMTRSPIEARHISVLLAMDQVFLSFFREGQAACADGVKTLPPASKHVINDVLFDNMFPE